MSKICDCTCHFYKKDKDYKLCKRCKHIKSKLYTKNCRCGAALTPKKIVHVSWCPDYLLAQPSKGKGE